MEVFVVRLWTPSGDEVTSSAGPAESVRGTALHVPSGRTVVFSDPDALLSFLTRQAAQAGRQALMPANLDVSGSPELVADA